MSKVSRVTQAKLFLRQPSSCQGLHQAAGGIFHETACDAGLGIPAE